MMAELLALVYIRDMNLNDGTLQRTDTIVERHRSMGVGSCIQHDAIKGKAHLLHLIDQLALHITLEIGNLDVRILSLQLRQVLLKRRRTVNTWFADAKKVQIRTINNLNFHISKKNCIFAPCKGTK